jgi:hypothetical protein
MRSSQGWSAGTESSSARAYQARASVCCTTSSPSATEPVMRAAKRWRSGRSSSTSSRNWRRLSLSWSSIPVTLS